MLLYFTPGACSLSVHIALQESGLPFERERVDLKQHRTASGEDYFGLNAKGYVPGLRLDDGSLLTEGAAIVQYVADLVPERGLAPSAGSMARVRLQEWLSFIGSEIHKGFGPLWNPLVPPETRSAAEARLYHWFDWLAPQLATRPYLLEGGYSVADGYLFTCLNWCNFLQLSLDKWPSLQAYLTRMSERPAVQAALRAEGLKA